jgi:AraC-like DNA-binding protein/mannose-6-phosphate isomerase-like protein (cupin superfamily)
MDSRQMKIISGESILFLGATAMHHVQIVHGSHVTNAFARHVHQKFCVGVVLQGDRVISQAGRSVTIPENALFVINPGVAHSCKSLSKTGHSYLVICVGVEKMQQMASQISGKAQPLPVIRDVLLFDPDLVSKMHRLVSLLKQANSSLQRESVFISMLATLMMRYGEMPPVPCRMGLQSSAIKRVRDFIEARFRDNPSLEELSGIACLSPFHFHRLFLRNIGVSPHEYLIQVRIRKARELLLEGNRIASVALELGFVDQSHFTRHFKRVIGVAPGKFIQTHKAH